MSISPTVQQGAIPGPNFGAESQQFGQTEGEATQPVLPGSDRSVADWLDAFVAGECDRAVLLRGVADVLAANRDAGWELLSLLDQYHRRKKLSGEDFQALNAQLQVLLFSDPPAANATPLATPGTASAPEGPAPGAPPADQGSATTDCGPPRRPRTIVVGELLCDRYRIQGVLGRGGMGIVYAAIDRYRVNEPYSGRRVAIKVLNADTTRGPQLLEELRGEFQRVKALSHPNIVRVHDFDRDGELTFFTMEHLSGASLGRVLGSRNSAALRRAHALSIIRQVGAAVAYAHSRGVVHGDLNPRNIFITDDGDVRVLDFGASHRLRPNAPISEPDDPSRIAVATPSYASCETLVGRRADTRDDVYSLACISYVLLRGRHPFHGSNALVARTKGLSPTRPSGLNARQWRALKAGLEMDREHRPGKMSAWLDDLGLARKPPSLPPLSTLAHAQPPREGNAPWLACGLIALAAGVFWWARSNSELAQRLGAQVTAIMAAPQSQVSRQVRVQPAVNVPRPALRRVALPTPPPLALPAAPRSGSGTASVVAAGSHDATSHPVIAAREHASTTTQRTPPPPARIELAADSLVVSPLQPAVRVTVHRRRNYRNGVSFSWWTESGTAKPGQDFAPVKVHTDYIPAGESETQLLVPIVADPRRQLAKTFYVLLGYPSDDATLGSRTITMVTIPAVN